MATAALSMTPATATSSLILALHARYEQGFEEYNRLDEASLELREGDPEECGLRFRYKEGMIESARETDQIRNTILWQVPSTSEDATIIAYHLWSLYDGQTNFTDDEKQALEVGMNSLFDFLVGEGCADMEKMGRQFSRGAMLAWTRRRTRTGLIEEAA